MSDIVVAPFSNSDIRNWPPGHYAALIGLVLENDPASRVHVVGTPGQRLGACEIVRDHPADRVVNQCGRMAWGDTLALLRGAACVIGNNSGVVHVSGHYGVPTVCVFGGSHSRREWRPRGERVVVVSRAVACSPCQYDHNRLSPYDKACLRDIAPAVVADAVRLAIAGVPAPAGQETT